MPVYFNVTGVSFCNPQVSTKKWRCTLDGKEFSTKNIMRAHFQKRSITVYFNFLNVAVYEFFAKPSCPRFQNGKDVALEPEDICMI